MLQDRPRFSADIDYIIRRIVPGSHGAHIGASLLCLAAFLWLNAAHLMYRLETSSPDVAGKHIVHAPMLASTTWRPIVNNPIGLPRAYAATVNIPIYSMVSRRRVAAIPESETMIGGADPAPGQTWLDDEFRLDRASRDSSASGTDSVMQVVGVEKGDTLIDILTDAGVEWDEALAAVDALHDVFRAGDLMPGQEIKLDLAVDGGPAAETVSLVALNLQPSAERDVNLARSVDGDFIAAIVERPLVQVPVRLISGIGSSLFDAGVSNDVPPSVMSEVMRAFSRDIDFQRDVQPGDSFEVVYESYQDEDGTPVRAGRVIFAAMTLGDAAREIYRFDDGKNADYFNGKGESTRKALLSTPVDGARISSGFGMRKHPIQGYNRMHKGVDFAAPTGTPVYAAGDGVVVQAGRNGAYGKYVRLRHGSGYATAYAHMSRISTSLKPGVRVRQGQVIGFVGSTGRSTGPHLHYEVLKNGSQINPKKVLLPLGQKLHGETLNAFLAAKADVDALRDRLGGETLLVSALGGLLPIPAACASTGKPLYC